MKGGFSLAIWVLALVPNVLVAQRLAATEPNSREPAATVELIAFSTRGVFLPLAPIVVEVFQSEGEKNLAAKFRNGVAEGVPFGIYRMKARLSGFYPEERYVRVNQQRTTVVLGLEVGRIDFPGLPYSLHGRIVGQPLPASKKSFVKLTGIYSSLSMESAVGPDGAFEFSGFSDGLFLLLVANEDGILGSRVLRLPDDLPKEGIPLAVEIGTEPIFRWR